MRTPVTVCHPPPTAFSVKNVRHLHVPNLPFIIARAPNATLAECAQESTWRLSEREALHVVVLSAVGKWKDGAQLSASVTFMSSCSHCMQNNI